MLASGGANFSYGLGDNIKFGNAVTAIWRFRVVQCSGD